ncbi:hypothetical protein GYMLUDRAFT_711004 [Collybiopsis luxurians FD-317 M1]|nr:hypothetical protein GYMLUDRAFT_711004 [Collybiopsis luxurians FD-317 M1]
MSEKKLILVIGATGLQGMPVVNTLLASRDGKPSPYSVRALTRDPTSEKAQALASMGVEVIKGHFEDLAAVAAALEGCYGVFVNTDTNTVGAKDEIYSVIKMFEQAHRVPQLRHFVWSGLDYSSKLGNYDPKYRSINLDAKGIVSDFIRAQPSSPSGDSFTWTIFITGVYFENISGAMMGPLPERDENGALVFALPIEDGHMPVISLKDIGWWARYIFDHRSETSGQEVKIADKMVTVDDLVDIVSRTTGIPTVRKRIPVEEYLDHHPRLNEVNRAKLSGMFWTWRDDLMTRDIEWLKSVHPDGQTLEEWIKETGYDGTLSSATDMKRYLLSPTS